MKNLHLLFLGENGFPHGFGAIQRQLLLARGWIAQGGEATVLCYKGVHGPNQDFPPSGVYQGVQYHYVSGDIHRVAGFFKRNWGKLPGKIREFKYIRKLQKAGKADVCFVSTHDVIMLAQYWVYLTLIGIPMALNYVELNSAIDSRTSFREKVNDWFFDRLAPRLTHAAFPISDYLIEEVNKRAPGKLYLKTPILCDFDSFDPDLPTDPGVRFVYCGAASYWELIRFVLAAFDRLVIDRDDVCLELILGGTPEEIERVRAAIDQCVHRAHIELIVNLPHPRIPEHYARATALLIPLRPTIQDAARFPHKLGEYLASGRAVITTAYGEIRNYDFVDGHTALIAEQYDEAVFSNKMQMVLEQKETVLEIGRRGREMGLRNFDFRKVAGQVYAFLYELQEEEDTPLLGFRHFGVRAMEVMPARTGFARVIVKILSFLWPLE